MKVLNTQIVTAWSPNLWMRVKVNETVKVAYSHRKPPSDGFDCTLDECRHHHDAQSTSRHNKNLDKLALSLEILRDHQSGAVATHADAHADNCSVAEKQLMKLWCKRREQTSERPAKKNESPLSRVDGLDRRLNSRNESTDDSRQARWLSLAHADR